jgi:putative tryptophan/tyrosine transport system substrate-binding protein
LHDGLTATNLAKIIGFAQQAKLPTVFQLRQYVDAGGLMSYGVNYCHHLRRAAAYADRILKGTHPSDLPVELPTHFEFIINRKTADFLGLDIPISLLARADEVIE